MALTSWTAMAAAIKNKAQNTLWWVKGEGESEIYALEVDPATGRLPVDAIVSFGYDTDWGIVGTDTLRTAAQIGNDLGPADFGNGIMTVQTLRVAVASDCTVAVSGTVAISGTVAATQSGSWTVGATQSGVWSVAVSSSALPTGAATEATLAAASGKLPAALGQTTMAGSMSVTLASDQSSIPVSATPVVAFNTGTVGATTQQVVQAGRVMADKSSLAVTNITAAAYTQLIASTAAVCSLIDVTNTTGEPMIIAVGAAAAEVDLFYVGPAGSVLMPITVAAGSRISAKSLGSTATSGYLILNLIT